MSTPIMLKIALPILLFISSSFSSASENESFENFMRSFSVDESFQKERVKFPLPSERLDYPPPENGMPALDVEVIAQQLTRKEWKHLSFYGEGQQYRSQVFDNFDKVLRDTDQRVFSWLGIENGIKIHFYFRRIEGKWYLVKIEDFSI